MTQSLLRDVPHAALLLEGSRIVYLNRAAVRLLGGDSEADWVGANLGRSLRSGRIPAPDTTRPQPDTLQRADGTQLPVQIESFGLDSGDSHLTRIYLHRSAGESTASRFHQGDATRKTVSDQELRSILAALPDLIMLLDSSGVILECNRSRMEVASIPGEDFVGRPLSELLPPEDSAKITPAISRSLREQAVTSLEFTRTTGATTLCFDIRLVPHHGNRLVAIFRNVTGNRRSEDLLLDERKMEGIGRLAGGIARDFNNLLTAVVAHSEFARTEVPPDGVLSKHLDQILLATDRAAELTRKLLSFSKNRPGRVQPVDLRELARGLTDVIRRWLGERIDLRLVCGREPCTVLADPHQLEILLTNLVLNARDAMPEGGRLTIATRPFQLRKGSCRGARRKPGDYAQVIVHDTGTGMTEEVRRRIFEPFFTTKRPAAGAGLGLATCYGIVKQLDGQISALTRPGGGTTFVIHLPRHDGVLPGAAWSPEWPGPKESGTLLLVEDETLVREVTTKALTRLGYTVLTAEHGLDGIEVARNHQGRIDALVTDIVMPHLGGREMATRLRVQLPHLKVLYISGYTHTALEARDLRVPGTAFLHKPFTPSELGGKLRQLLGSVSG
ncbi:MAG: ATP-binding protein [Planctomycetota bacterium]